MMERRVALRMNWKSQKCEVNQLLFVDGSALVAESKEKLRSLVKAFGRGS